MHPAPPPVEPSARQLHSVFRAYKETELKIRRPPRNVDDITAALNAAGASASDLVSPVDHQPYVIVWGSSTVLGPHNMPRGGNSGGPTSFAILAYEAQGADGKRFAVDIRGQVARFTADEFQRATFLVGHKPK